MKVCIAQLKSATPYSQSKQVDRDDFPFLPDETHEQYDKRLWREKATVDAQGVVCIPGMALKMSVDEAVKRMNIRTMKTAKTTFTKFFLAGQIADGDVNIKLKKADLQSIDIWANADGVRGSGKRVKRRFPYILDWEGTARFLILDDTIPKDVFEQSLVGAGKLVGIGRFRPEKGGFLGRFSVEDFTWQVM